MKPLFSMSLLLSYLYIVNIIINGVQTTAISVDFKGNETDRLALLDIKSKITHDPLGVLNSWNESNHFCEWKGVICGRRHHRVVLLNLSNSDLVGSLSPSIGNLSFLRKIFLYNNTLSGHIPPEVGRLFRLRALSLLNNSFEGEIPTNISGCSQLFLIQLFNNKLVGKLPVGLSFLSKLKYLGLSNNNFIGDLSHLSNLTSLKILSLSNPESQGSGFSGKIPDFIGDFKNLIILDLGGNSFTGRIPSSLYNLSNLQELSLAGNSLEGVLSTEVGFSFPQLGVLQLYDNQLSGPIPFSLSNLSNIQILDLSYNNFAGKFAFDGRRMSYLSLLDLSAAITGRGELDEFDFLKTLVNCTFLRIVIVRDNNFGGKIPQSIANLSVQMIGLELSNNIISGSIPSGLGNLLNLQFLALQFNQLTGAIPPNIGDMYNLERISLSNNLLSGMIPLSIGNLSMLSLAYLSNNKFHGPMPATIGNCKNLLKLDLSNNMLVGFIPQYFFEASALIELYLQENMFQGSLPLEIGGLKNLITINMSSNNMNGYIPSSIGQCASLTNLYLDCNLFDGTIPLSFSNLQSLQSLDLSSNNLSGQVPKYFSNFSYLTYLNLSFNNFEGDVPKTGVFSNVTGVFLNGNNKLCGGIPQLRLPRCELRKSKAKNKSRALIFSVSISCFVVGLVILSSIYLFCTKMRKKQASSETPSRESFIQLSYGMLLKASNGFSNVNLIGSGSFSSVYKGTLLIDRVEKSVAIKVLNNMQQGASQSFLAECEALRVIRHRNIVRVLTACSSIDFQGNAFNAIVYEFMSKGSLERWLYSNPEVDQQFQSLNLLQRLNIAIDVAQALDYIQSVCKNPFVHCDLKPSNILLDDDLVAHVGDFGLVKLPPEIAETLPNYISLGVRGTVGYTPPEYGLGVPISTVGDVYSYGIVMLELMTAKKPTDVMFEGDMNLHEFVASALPDHVSDILDPKLIVNNCNEEKSIDLDNTRETRNCDFECITSIMKVGVLCSSYLPQDRMEIKDVIRQLQRQKDQLVLCRRRHRCHLIV